MAALLAETAFTRVWVLDVSFLHFTVKPAFPDTTQKGPNSYLVEHNQRVAGSVAG
jgi:hypothetical protein